jgi:BirA family biotin operon repressor/biotin-[acetyl-CoA-carboxylase] ligase
MPPNDPPAEDTWPSAVPSTRFSVIKHVAETGSTNDDVRIAALDGASEGLVVVADHQSAGRGRLGRTWQAPVGSSLLVSMLLRPPLRLDEVHLVATALGVAAVDAVGETAGVRARIKWPNDLLVDVGEGRLRKLSGMLAETVVDGDRVGALVLGIGINVNWPAELPSELQEVAVALNHLAGREVDRVALLVALLAQFERHYAAVTTGADADRRRLLGDYRARSATIGRRVQVDLGHERFVGDALDVDDDGHLLVVDDCPDRPRTVVAGDVVHLRQ